MKFNTKVCLLVLCILFIGALSSKLRMKAKNKLKLKSKLKSKSKNKLQSQAQAKIQAEADGTVLQKGWMEFVAVPKSKWIREFPKKFEINPSYEEQLQQAPVEGSDDAGPLGIPSDTSFFFVLTRNTLYALTARQNDLAKTRKSISIDWIKPYTLNAETNMYEGGLTDLGNNANGFCFKLYLKNDAVWGICVPTRDEEKNWINAIIPLLKKDGRGADLAENAVQLPPEFNMMNMGASNEEREGNIGSASKNGPVDGVWQTIQDWSQCTLACGGGKSYLQRICIPPKNGGKPCVGPKVQVKNCNENPCPTAPGGEQKSRTLPAVVNMDKVSMRPQRYEPCIVKEGDVMIKFPAVGNRPSPKLPIRAILNTKTLTLFSSSVYEKVYKSFDLRYLTINQSKTEPSQCMALVDKRDNAQNAEICISLISLLPKQTTRDALNEWGQQISMFRDKCDAKTDWKSIDDDANKLKQQVDLDVQAKKVAAMRDYDAEQKQMEGNNDVSYTANMAVDAVGNELKYEQLAIKEEMQKEAYEQAQLEKNLNSELEKSKCMERDQARKDKAVNDQEFDISKQQKIDLIKSNAGIQINSNRQKTMERINAMKAEAQRKRELAKQRIMKVRNALATSLLHAMKDGNKDNCLPSKEDAEKKKYCLEEIADMTTQIQCLNAIALMKGWCGICCDNEFGSNFPKKKIECQDMCEDPAYMTPDPAVGKPTGTAAFGSRSKDGNWVFVKTTDTV